MPMSKASGMQEALREVVGKEIMVVVISQCESAIYSLPSGLCRLILVINILCLRFEAISKDHEADNQAQNQQFTHYTPKVVSSLISVSLFPCSLSPHPPEWPVQRPFVYCHIIYSDDTHRPIGFD